MTPTHMHNLYDLLPGSRLYEFSVSCGMPHEEFVKGFHDTLDVIEAISFTPWPAEQVLLLMLFRQQNAKPRGTLGDPPRIESAPGA